MGYIPEAATNYNYINFPGSQLTSAGIVVCMLTVIRLCLACLQLLFGLQCAAIYHHF